ncbi:uncharacterized protein LOC129795188 isoform X2 [Lutzomyia longipalpis]|uniref:uncharacterized protein LOC129795188 isoform X2 n=1 Tax=Lutzomyia longipalpis TaxID=7200 RepID=UPI00248349B9|nr:uncharacterized protein LOC129795188 isoform X2 [Lutzomyia longipalpis]
MNCGLLVCIVALAVLCEATWTALPVFGDMLEQAVPGLSKLERGAEKTFLDQFGNLPWLGYLTSQHSDICAAAVLSDTSFITAAHCVEGYKEHNLVARFGRNGYRRFIPKECHVHPQYRKYDRDFDVAICKVDGGLEDADGRRARIPERMDYKALPFTLFRNDNRNRDRFDWRHDSQDWRRNYQESQRRSFGSFRDNSYRRQGEFENQGDERYWRNILGEKGDDRDWRASLDRGEDVRDWRTSLDGKEDERDWRTSLDRVDVRDWRASLDGKEDERDWRTSLDRGEDVRDWRTSLDGSEDERDWRTNLDRGEDVRDWRTSLDGKEDEQDWRTSLDRGDVRDWRTSLDRREDFRDWRTNFDNRDDHYWRRNNEDLHDRIPNRQTSSFVNRDDTAYNAADWRLSSARKQSNRDWGLDVEQRDNERDWRLMSDTRQENRDWRFNADSREGDQDWRRFASDMPNAPPDWSHTSFENSQNIAPTLRYDLDGRPRDQYLNNETTSTADRIKHLLHQLDRVKEFISEQAPGPDMRSDEESLPDLIENTSTPANESERIRRRRDITDRILNEWSNIGIKEKPRRRMDYIEPLEKKRLNYLRKKFEPVMSSGRKTNMRFIGPVNERLVLIPNDAARSPVVGLNQCNRQLQNSVATERMICVGDVIQSSCSNDNWPLVNENAELLGMPVWKTECTERSQPFVFTFILQPDVRRFIRDVSGV